MYHKGKRIEMLQKENSFISTGDLKYIYLLYKYNDKHIYNILLPLN